MKGGLSVNVRGVFLLCAFLLASACATPPKEPELADLPVEATVVWGNQGRGGAAERAPAYVHALHRGGVVYRDAPGSPELQPPTSASHGLTQASVPDVPAVASTQHNELLPPQTVAAIAAISARHVRPGPFQTAEAISIGGKQHGAWEKYCDGGYEMTDEEWQLVREAGAPDNVPVDLVNHCVHPK